MLPTDHPPATTPFPCGRVLLVEDNDTYRQVAAAALGQYLTGCQIIEAATVTAALAALHSLPIKVVVTDMTLPDGSAIDLIEKSQEFVRQGIKIVVFSNYSRDDMLPVLDRAGVHSYVEKAHGLKALAQAVQAAIHHEPHAPPHCQ